MTEETKEPTVEELREEIQKLHDTITKLNNDILVLKEVILRETLSKHGVKQL